MAMIPSNKTPVSVLQELFMERGIVPMYECVAKFGEDHQAQFLYTVRAEGYLSIGKGTSKKSAKHNAAFSVLKEIEAEGTTGFNISRMDDMTPLQLYAGTYSNPYNELLQLCSSRGRSPPVYEYQHTEQGLEKYFIVICVVDEIKKTGKGKLKKTAKREAAHLMRLTLRDLPVAASVYAEPTDVQEQLVTNVLVLKLSEAKICENQFQDKQSTLSEHQMMRLKEIDLESYNNCSFVTLLYEMFDEQEFPIKYKFEISEEPWNSEDDTEENLVKSYIFHPLICSGEGKTKEEANEVAAKNMISYLKRTVVEATKPAVPTKPAVTSKSA